MSFFNCTICGDSHKLVTLLEFPQPEIISKITSGEVDLSLDVVSKNGFLINRETIIYQSLLSLPIIDFEDNFDLLIWVKIERKEYLPKLEKLRESDFQKLNIKAVLNDPIPFFTGTDNLKVEVEVDAEEEEHLFSIVKIEKDIKLNFFLRNGISKKELAIILSPLYH